MMKRLALTLTLLCASACKAAAPPMPQCMFNSDCKQPLVCANAMCRVPCLADRDCPDRFVCGIEQALHVCESTHECIYDHECGLTERCAADGLCHPQCQDDRDCRRYGRRSVCDLNTGECIASTLDAGVDVPTVDVPTDISTLELPVLDVPADVPVFTALRVPPRVRHLNCGPDYCCAISNSGTVRCWGSNSAGQIDRTGPTDHLAPTPVPGLPTSGIAHVSTGTEHVCALDAGGTVRCWGTNSSSQFDTMTAQGVQGVTVLSSLTTGTITALQVLAGNGFTCVLGYVGTMTTNVGVRCWGNTNNARTNGSMITSPLSANVVPTASRLTELSPHGFSGACVLGDDSTGGLSTPWCWGDDQLGQVGSMTTSSAVSPAIRPLGAATVSDLETGGKHTCAISPPGGVSCWGDNTFGQSTAVPPPMTQSVLPTLVPITGTTATPIQLAVGSAHTCVLMSDGTVRCWGVNNLGECGSNAASGPCGPGQTDSCLPVVDPGITGAAEIAAGANFTCVLRPNNTVLCWGSNAHGQLGITADTSPHTLPQVISIDP